MLKAIRIYELGVDLGMKQLYRIRIKRDIRSISDYGLWLIIIHI
jgi:hypothetical protein